MQAPIDIAGTRPRRAKTSGSPRQPIWKISPNVITTFGSGLIEDRPAAACIVARIISNWTDIEVAYANLLAQIMGANIKPAAAVFGALRTSRGKRDVIQAAAEACLSEADLRLFNAYAIRKSDLEKERNHLAHGCFGISEKFKEDLIWTSQSDYINYHTSLKFAPDSSRKEFKKKQFLYTLGTLERIAQEMEEFNNQTSSFRGYLFARDQSNHEFCLQRYSELSEQPHIQQALSKIPPLEDTE